MSVRERREAGKAEAQGQMLSETSGSQTANTHRNSSTLALAKDPDCLTDPRLCVRRAGTTSQHRCHSSGQPWAIGVSTAWGNMGCRESPRSWLALWPPPLPALGSLAGQAYPLGFICIHFGTNGFLPYLYHRINRDFPDQRLPRPGDNYQECFPN